MAKIRLGTKSIELPRNRLVRIIIGVLLVLGGIVGFLPILGFWMIPLGFVVLAADIRLIRRVNRRLSVAVSRWWTGRKAKTRSSSI